MFRHCPVQFHLLEFALPSLVNACRVRDVGMRVSPSSWLRESYRFPTSFKQMSPFFCIFKSYKCGRSRFCWFSYNNYWRKANEGNILVVQLQISPDSRKNGVTCLRSFLSEFAMERARCLFSAEKLANRFRLPEA